MQTQTRSDFSSTEGSFLYSGRRGTKTKWGNLGRSLASPGVGLRDFLGTHRQSGHPLGPSRKKSGGEGDIFIVCLTGDGANGAIGGTTLKKGP